MKTARLPMNFIHCLTVSSLVTVAAPMSALAEDYRVGSQETLPAYLNDRGVGIPTSMFGTYVEKGELLVYPFFEYYLDNNLEYKPEELGFGLDADYRARYRASEGLIFVGYGISDRLAIEFEAAIIDAKFEKSSDDTTAVPAKIEESGTGDVEGQVRLRWTKENEKRPEFFSYFEAVSPQQKDKLLIGTPDWEFKLGSGLIRGFRWGTMTFRAAMDYSIDESKLDLGEIAIEYLKRVTPSWRLYAGLEGSQDEVSLVTEAQWHLNRHVFLKLNNAVGITSKATDWAPEVGVVLSFPVK
ncbi:MAG TPA: hypothetical protein VN285_13355 [Candidatus Deferrimicrobium sp.]|nr:hypothetical protein [Candidatus Deferrimicrobium sp.]